jgi:hypothetical protein
MNGAEPAVISLLSLVFAVLVAVLGLVVRGAVRWTRVEDRLTDFGGDLTRLVQDEERTHRELVEQMREDRKATNERLTYLERSVWPRPGRRPGNG